MKAKESKWAYENGSYCYNGWKVHSTGFEWIIVNPDGERYATTYQTIGKAEAFAERKMQLPKWANRKGE